MKKLLGLICAGLLTAGIVTAQDAPAKAPAPKTDAKMAHENKCDMKNCCMMQDGKMMCMMDGKEMAMDKEMTAKNGTKIMPDGTCMMKDGKKMMMKNGDCCDMNGNMGHMAAPKKEMAKPAAK